eukprot:5170733-Heterocapsa_arctica.AAC.1
MSPNTTTILYICRDMYPYSRPSRYYYQVRPTCSAKSASHHPEKIVFKGDEGVLEYFRTLGIASPDVPRVAERRPSLRDFPLACEGGRWPEDRCRLPRPHRLRAR